MLIYRLRLHRRSLLAFCFCCLLPIVGIISGCGHVPTGEGEGFDYPQVNPPTITTEPSRMTSAGGTVNFETFMFRRGDTYLTDAAGSPSFSVLTPLNLKIVEDRVLTLKERVSPSPEGYTFENSGTYSGSFTVPANAESSDRAYRLIFKVPRVNGRPYQQQVYTVIVPAATPE